MAEVNSVNVPIKLDASALTRAIQQAAASAGDTIRVDPSEMIKNSAIKMKDMYDRFNVIKQFGAELNGKPMSDPLPSSIVLESIDVRFRVMKDGATTEPLVAKILNVACIADIAPLLSTEMGAIAVQLEQEAAAIKNTAANTEDVARRAKEAWAANNPDRRIRSAAELDGETVDASDISLQDKNASEQI
jgi:hypothetical protein